MLVWINGPFGGGKTQTAYEIQRRLARSVVCDPGQGKALEGREVPLAGPPSSAYDFSVTSQSVPSSATVPAALFVGLCRLDWIQFVSREYVPQVFGAGGPATSAAVTFAFLGGQATLLTGVGSSRRADPIRSDLQRTGVRLIDAAEADDSPPASLYRRFSPGADLPELRSAQNATGPRVSPPPSLEASVAESRAVLVDGHHPSLANAAARAAREHGRPCLLDGRSWQQITHHLLPFTDITVCSADSRPRDHRRRVPNDPLGFLLDHGVSWAAITDGPRPIRWASRANGIQPDIAVPAVAVADTLGAGDVFCGALTHAIAARPVANEESFGAALQFAARVAAYSCQSFATRAWMNSWPGLR